MIKRLGHPVRRFASMITFVIVLIAIQPFLWNFVVFSAERYNNKRTEEEQFQNVQSRLVVIQAASQAEGELLSQLDTIFPADSTASGPVERLEELALDAGVILRINSISDTDFGSDGKKTPGIVKLKINIDVLGDAVALLEYLEAIEHTQELTTIDFWNLQPAKISEDNPGFGYNLTADVAFYLQTD